MLISFLRIQGSISGAWTMIMTSDRRYHPKLLTWRNIVSTGRRRESWWGEGRQVTWARAAQSAITACTVESSSEVQVNTDTVTLLSRLEKVNMIHNDDVGVELTLT